MARGPSRTAGGVMGVVLALTVVAAWCCSLAVLLAAPLPVGGAVIGLVAVPWMTWLSTGLFITAHDAMHGTVAPGRRWLNDVLGRVAAGIYAGFGFSALRSAHAEHHAHPATGADPDYHDGEHTGPVRWYLRFVGHYLTWRQMIVMAAAYNVLAHVLHVAEWRLVLFWVVPVVLSTIQLFVFGTYLPHRQGPPPYAAVSSNRPRWLSLLACFHFDYHREHHALPHLAWWQLPAARWGAS